MINLLKAFSILWGLTVLCSICQCQPNIEYSFIAAGHAYGSHDGDNIGLHPLFLNSLNNGFDTSIQFIVFTGDIVNYCTIESWEQVDAELDNYSLPYYYSMGNHGANPIGYSVFEDKFGGTYYSFYNLDGRVLHSQNLILEKQIDCIIHLPDNLKDICIASIIQTNRIVKTEKKVLR